MEHSEKCCEPVVLIKYLMQIVSEMIDGRFQCLSVAGTVCGMLGLRGPILMLPVQSSTTLAWLASSLRCGDHLGATVQQ